MMAAAPLLHKRTAHGPEATFAATRALCNRCGRLTEARVVFEDDKVFLVKWCPEHGVTRTLISSDREWYLRSLGYVKPGTTPRDRAVHQHHGCPDSCGLCPEHQQHTCVPILEITDSCQLSCPICLVEGRTGAQWSLEQVRGVIDNLIRYEGTLNMLTLSGGEPTLHPDFLEVVDATLRPEIGIVSVSTNGLALEEDEDLIKELRDRDVVISLQFDGLKEETYRKLRGRGELARLKQRLVDKILAIGGRLSLTVTLARGVNEDELPSILQLLFDNDNILSIMIQPLAYNSPQLLATGDLLDAITIPEVVSRLVEASGGVLTHGDFSPLPCSHPSCFALTYLLKTQQDRLVSIPSVVETEDYLDIIKNQALLGTDWETLEKVKDAIYGLWSSSGLIPDGEAVLKKVKQILVELNRIGRDVPHREVLSVGTRHVKSIFIHHFMDRASFDLSRAVKCCNHYPMPDGRLLPCCVRNCIS